MRRRGGSEVTMLIACKPLWAVQAVPMKSLTVINETVKSRMPRDGSPSGPWLRSCCQNCMVTAVSVAPGVQHIRVLRVLCREEFSTAAARTFVEDVKRAMEWLTGHFLYTPEQVLHQWLCSGACWERPTLHCRCHPILGSSRVSLILRQHRALPCTILGTVRADTH